MKKGITFFILFSFMVCSFAFSGFSQDSGSTQRRIAEIKVEGNNAVSTPTILSRLKIASGDDFDEGAINKELRRLYATGFFADVSVDIVERPEGITVVFTVKEKPVISVIEFRGNRKVKKVKLLKKVTIKPGDLLDHNAASQNSSEIRAFYVEQGYSNVTVAYEIETDQSTGQVKIIFVIDEGETIKIKKITFEGNNSVKTGELKKFMATKTAWWFIRKGALKDDEFEGDLSRIRSYYRSKGFLDALVTSRFDYSEDGKFMFITIVIAENKQYMIGEIVVEGQLAFPEEEVRDQIKIKTGDPFDYGEITNTIDALKALYYDKGYMNAEIDVNNRYNSATEAMDITFEITAHDEVYVGSVNIIGNTQTKDKVIRREVRAYPGEKYDGVQLKKSKEKLYNLGFFEDVYFDTSQTGDTNVKDLNITVKEAKTGELSFGGGYSSVDAFIGFVQIRQKNFDAMNFPTFTGAGQDLIIRGEIGSARTNYLLSWTDPWIFDLPYSFGFDLYRQEHEQYGDSGYDYDEKRTGGSLRLGKDLTDEVSMGLKYNLEEVDISDIPDTASEDLKDEDGKKYISRLIWSTQYDNRDNKFSPTKGVVAGMMLQDAGGIIGGDKDFVKGTLSAAYYYSIIPNVVLELSAVGGMAEPYSDTKKIPIYERFFVGGAETIRGYSERSVGPRDANDRDIRVGGNSMLVGNAEVTFPLYKKLIKGAVFFDVGSAMKDAGDIFDTNEYKSGTGVGVRVKTPIGPLQLDYGFPLNDNEGDKKEGHFYFSMSHGF